MGLKIATDAVDEIIKWANLAGDNDLPDRLPLPATPATTGTQGQTLSGLMEALDKLPPVLRAHLHDLMNRPEKWPEKPADARHAYQKKLSFLPKEEAARYLKGMDFRFACQFSAVYRRYKLILAARETLSAIVRGDDFWPTTAFMTRGPNGKGKYAGDPISDALLEAEIDYIKRCPRPQCRVFFYAGKHNINAYPPACQAALLEQQRRKRKAEKREREAKVKEETRPKTKKR